MKQVSSARQSTASTAAPKMSSQCHINPVEKKKSEKLKEGVEAIDYSIKIDDVDKLVKKNKDIPIKAATKIKVQTVQCIKYILAFFAGSDGIVFENINNNFADVSVDMLYICNKIKNDDKS